MENNFKKNIFLNNLLNYFIFLIQNFRISKKLYVLNVYKVKFI